MATIPKIKTLFFFPQNAIRHYKTHSFNSSIKEKYTRVLGKFPESPLKRSPIKEQGRDRKK